MSILCAGLGPPPTLRSTPSTPAGPDYWNGAARPNVRCQGVSIPGRLIRRVDEGRSTLRLTRLINEEIRHMRFMVIVKATPETEAGVLPDQKILTEMGKFNEELTKAGVMLAGEGLQASSKGARVRFQGSKRTVIDGPFSETKELIAGFWLWQVRSKEEAIQWLKRAPFQEGEVEIRQVFEAEDFGADFTPELREQEERIRQQIATKK